MVIGGYQEEIFQRAERQFRTMDAMLGWLSSFKEKPGNAYEKDAVLVAEELQTSIEITQKARESRSPKELLTLSTEANKLKFNQDEPLGSINDRIRELEGEADVMANTIKTSRDFTEVNKAVEDLRELNPKKLGGIRSGQVRFRGSKKEMKIIGESLGFTFPIEE